ncbi:MAG: DNA-binding protein WhiA [Clostridia bacterium]|nr:DNA-binding protein WhiA [Clostridia bacterium]
MSFSIEQKKQIIEEQQKNSCCRKAFLCGILSSKAELCGDKIYVSLEKDEFIDFVEKLVTEFYGKLLVREKNKNGGRLKLAAFDSKSASKYMRSIADGAALYQQKCPSCTSSFFKGVFFACGKFSDPANQYFLELSPKFNIQRIYDELLENGLNPRVTSRLGNSSLYFRRAGEIEDFCGFVGMTGAMFDIANTQIEREFLNNTNRIVNCETNNIGRSVTASAKQIEAIRALMERNLLSNLPDELEYTARLRIENESLSLAQLSKLFSPPISKSGLSHRLTKIMEFSELLLSEKK